MSLTEVETHSSGSMLFVGQDKAGHWLVQESHGLLEGRFISFAAALQFARAERLRYRDARVVVTATPLVPQIPFAPVGTAEVALRRAA